MNELERQRKSVMIEMTAAMLRAGIDYALNHQGELIAAFENLNGKKNTRKKTGEPIDITPVEEPRSPGSER